MKGLWNRSEDAFLFHLCFSVGKIFLSEHFEHDANMMGTRHWFLLSTAACFSFSNLQEIESITDFLRPKGRMGWWGFMHEMRPAKLQHRALSLADLPLTPGSSVLGELLCWPYCCRAGCVSCCAGKKTQARKTAPFGRTCAPSAASWTCPSMRGMWSMRRSPDTTTVSVCSTWSSSHLSLCRSEHCLPPQGGCVGGLG